MNQARTNPQIKLLSEKLADTVGEEMLAPLEKEDQEEIFEQMLTSLYMTSWCGTTFRTIETLLSKLEKINEPRN